MEYALREHSKLCQPLLGLRMETECYFRADFLIIWEEKDKIKYHVTVNKAGRQLGKMCNRTSWSTEIQGKERLICINCPRNFRKGKDSTLVAQNQKLEKLFLKNIYLFIWLRQVLVLACGIFSCGIWDLVPWPGIEPGPPALGVRSLSHWTIREAPEVRKTPSIY